MTNSIAHSIAQQLVSVQPMTGPTGQIFTLRVRYPDSVPKFSVINSPDTTKGWVMVEAQWEVAKWIGRQPIDQWIPVEFQRSYERHMITEELFVILALKWL